MNVYTLLGAAIVNHRIFELLLEDPVEAANKLGLFLTRGEVKALKEYLEYDHVAERLEVLTKTKGCPEPPCPLKLVLDDDCEENLSSAAD